MTRSEMDRVRDLLVARGWSEISQGTFARSNERVRLDYESGTVTVSGITYGSTVVLDLITTLSNGLDTQKRR